MRVPQRGRINRLDRQAPAQDLPAFFVVTGEPTPAQAEEIAQVRADGRQVQIVELEVVVSCPACGGLVPQAGGVCERCGRTWSREELEVQGENPTADAP